MNKPIGKSGLVVVRPTSGLREFLPNEQIAANFCTDIIRRHYELAGAVPLQTAAFERVEVLTAKEGGDAVDRQIYAVTRLAPAKESDADKDEGEDDDREESGIKHALRFDLTVPFARFASQNVDRLTLPFRRYQIQPVWRGERAQSGRYREFVQADIDVIGDGVLDILTDAEIVAIISGIFREMKIGPFRIRISNRKLLEGYLTGAGVPAARIPETMRIVDRLDKDGRDLLELKLRQRVGLDTRRIGLVARLISMNGASATVLDDLASMTEQVGSNSLFVQGLDELRAVADGIAMLGVPEEDWMIDPCVARGLSYYTGTVYETTLVDHPGIGSICSGGRYENLASLFTDRKLPGVGISIGVTRLISRLLEAEILKGSVSTLASVLVTSLDRSQMGRYLAMTGRLRRAGIGAEAFLEGERLGAQLRYASRKGFRLALIAGETEFTAGTWILRNLETGMQSIVRDADIESAVGGPVEQNRKG